MHQSVGKRKRELETEQNIPNKHFKADTEHVNIKFSEDYKHEMYLYQKEKVVSPPPNYTVPEGVIDIDLATMGNPAHHAEYARDTFQYYKLREATFKVKIIWCYLQGSLPCLEKTRRGKKSGGGE